MGKWFGRSVKALWFAAILYGLFFALDCMGVLHFFSPEMYTLFGFGVFLNLVLSEMVFNFIE